MINSLAALLSNCQVWGFIFQVFPVISGEPPVPIEFPSRLLLEDPVAAPCFLSDLQLIELNTDHSQDDAGNWNQIISYNRVNLPRLSSEVGLVLILSLSAGMLR